MPDPKDTPSPARQVLQAPRFVKSKRRLPPTAQVKVDDAVKGILRDPLSGEPKIGALKDVRVVKFKVGPLLLLLAYQFDEKRDLIEVLDVGPHENFYRDLQKYLDAR